MPEDIEGPIVIEEHGDVKVCPDAATALGDLETDDVRNDEYEAFDATGRPLELVPVGYAVEIRRPTVEAPPVPGFVDRMRRHARSIGSDRLGVDVEKADLEQLLAALLAVESLRWTFCATVADLLRAAFRRPRRCVLFRLLPPLRSRRKPPCVMRSGFLREQSGAGAVGGWGQSGSGTKR